MKDKVIGKVTEKERSKMLRIETEINDLVSAIVPISRKAYLLQQHLQDVTEEIAERFNIPKDRRVIVDYKTREIKIKHYSWEENINLKEEG